MTDFVGMRTVDTDPSTCQAGVRQVLDEVSFTFGDHVVVVPDVHYPYHWSTGLVTNPSTIAGVLEWLRDDDASRHIELAFAATRWDDDHTVARYLGYDDVTGMYDVDAITSTAVGTTRTVTIGDREEIITVPEWMGDDVLVVPTLRTGNHAPLVGGLDRLAAAALGRDPTRTEAIAYGAVVDPTAILDASYTFVGRPHRTRTFVAGADAAGVDRIAASMADVSADDLPARPLHPTLPHVRGIDVERIASTLPDAPRGRSSNLPLMAAGYRAYARLSGDHVPPQVLR